MCDFMDYIGSIIYMIYNIFENSIYEKYFCIGVK